MKSTGGSKGSRRAATSAADKAFLAKASSPYEETPSTTGPEAGRIRLKGAFLIPLDRIRPDPSQVRRTFDPVSLQEFSRALTEIGILQPIVVRYDEPTDGYVIVTGERRYRAALLAKFKEVPCLVREPGQDRVLLEQISENWQRQDLDPVELGRALVSLREAYNYTLDDLVRLTGKSKGEISKKLNTARNLAPQVQAKARANPKTLTGEHLYEISKLPAEQQPDLAREVRDKRLTSRETKDLVEERRLRSAGVRHKTLSTLTRRFVTHHGVVLVKTRRGQSSDDHVIAALKEAQRQIIDGRKE